MKNRKSNLISFAIPLVLIFLGSCSDGKLSNSKAENALKVEYPRYITTTVQIRDKNLSPGIPNELKLLTERELARYTYIPPGNRGYGCYGELTEEGKQYYVSTIGRDFIIMAVAKVELDKVSGIREIPAMNVSEVEYIEKIVEITPVGEIYNDINIGKTYNVTATFNKYNDGWRIDKLSTSAQKITISDAYSKAMESQAKYTDVEEFFNAFKKAVNTSGISEISKFVHFPLKFDSEDISMEDFKTGTSYIGVHYFDIVKETSSLQKYDENDYGIPGTGMKFSKHRDGYWKLDEAYGSPDFYR